MPLKNKLTLLLIFVLLALALMTLFWSPFNKAIDREEIKLGLDYEGGVRLVYQADLTKLPEGTSESSAISDIIKVLEKRINTYGVSESAIKKVGKDQIRVEIPSITNIDEARKRIGETALVKFKTFTASDKGNFNFQYDEEGNETGVFVPEGTGQYLAETATGVVDGQTVELTSQLFSGKVDVWIPTNSGRAEIQFSWNSEGAQLFEQLTTRLSALPENSVERRLGIFLGSASGDEYVSAPRVEGPIKEKGVITGMKLGEAKDLVQLLNAGRIPVPLTIIGENNVSPTLGNDSLDLSKKAGIVGTMIIIFFMILYYRLPGVVSGLALLMYAVLVLGTFKAIGVTLSLAGVAGFVLSLGMAVDANVLIFERMREEMRTGRTIRASVEVGFSRAWPAIRDSNVTTLITCGVLYWMGSTLDVPEVQGFAATLAIGVFISMFSALVITRSFLRLLGGSQLMNKQSLFIPISKKQMISGEER